MTTGTERTPADTYRGPLEDHACFVSANEMLGKRNTKLSFAMQIPSGESRLVIGTEKVSRGSKPLLMMANFCPFCGVHLP